MKHVKIGPLSLEAMSQIIPGLEDDVPDDEMLCVVIAGCMDSVIITGMVKGKTTLNQNGHAMFNRFMLRMKKVPPPERLEKALRSRHNRIMHDGTDVGTVARLVWKILTMGIVNAKADYERFISDTSPDK